MSNSLLGTLGAEYFYLYVLNQVPVGAAIAHWGVRKVLIVFMTLALAGNVLFAVTPAEAGLHVGRLLIGVGVSSAFLSFVTVIKEWFDPAEAALVMGLSMAVGVSGAIMGQVRTLCAGALCSAANLRTHSPHLAPRRRGCTRDVHRRARCRRWPVPQPGAQRCCCGLQCRSPSLRSPYSACVTLGRARRTRPSRGHSALTRALLHPSRRLCGTSGASCAAPARSGWLPPSASA